MEEEVFCIRRLQPRDAALLAQVSGLEKRMFKKGVSWKGSFETEVARKNVALYCILLQGSNLQAGNDGASAGDGCAAAKVAAYLMCRSTSLSLLVTKVAVAEHWRRRGLARRLMQHAAAEALRGRGGRTRGNGGGNPISVSLHVDVRNTPAMSLYGSLGFVEDSRITDYYGPGQDALYMAAEVDAAAAESWWPPPSCRGGGGRVGSGGGAAATAAAEVVVAGRLRRAGGRRS